MKPQTYQHRAIDEKNTKDEKLREFAIDVDDDSGRRRRTTFFVQYIQSDHLIAFAIHQNWSSSSSSSLNNTPKVKERSWKENLNSRSSWDRLARARNKCFDVNIMLRLSELESQMKWKVFRAKSSRVFNFNKNRRKANILHNFKSQLMSVFDRVKIQQQIPSHNNKSRQWRNF